MPLNSALSKNIRWGVTNGALFAAVFSVLAMFIAGSRGEIAGSQLWLVIAAYFASGISAGLVVGLVRPWTRRRLGAILVGIVAAVPAGLALQLAYDLDTRNAFRWSVALVFALIAGMLGGLIRWSQTWGRANDTPDEGRQ